MAQFNTRNLRKAVKPITPTGFITSEPTPTGVTFNGAPGFARDPQSELFLLGIDYFTSRDEFYERADERDLRFRQLLHACAGIEPDWLCRFVPWLRNEANMRSGSVVAALEAGWAMCKMKVAKETIRRMVDQALQRADEPGEAVAYWLMRFGKRMPHPIRDGIGDAAIRLWNEYTVLKYDTPSHTVRFADVLNMVHPKVDAYVTRLFPDGDQEKIDGWLRRTRALFQYIMDRRYGRETIQQIVGTEQTMGTEEEPALPMVYRNTLLRAKVLGSGPDFPPNPGALLDEAAIRVAGLTWEDALSLLGQFPDTAALKTQVWERMALTMPYFALLRNLRNMDQAGVSDDVAKAVMGRLTDPVAVAKSRLFPYRFLSAYRAVQSLRWGWAIEQALNLSLGNVPELPGTTLVLLDRSGSMFMVRDKDSGLTRADQATIFAVALTLRNRRHADLVQFGEDAYSVQLDEGESLLRAVDSNKFRNLGGTATERAIRKWYKGQDRVVILTDEQTNDYVGRGGVSHIIPATVPVYTWNLGGYKYGEDPNEGLRYTFGGLTDACFKMIPLLEQGESQSWPF